MRIQKKVFYGYGIVLGILFIAALLHLYVRYILYSDIKETSYIANEIDDMNRLAVSVLQLLMPGNDYLITKGDLGEIEKYRILYKDSIEKLGEVIKDNDKHGNIVAILKENIKKIDSISKKIFQIKFTGNGPQVGSALMKEMDKVGDITYELIKQHNKLNHDELGTLFERSRDNIRMANIVSFLTWVMLISLGGLVAYFFNRDIQRPIEKLSKGFQGVSHGRWSHVDLNQDDELSDLAREFNAMIERMSFSYEELENEVRSRTKELNELNKRLENISRLDGLTGLYNHKYFFERFFHEYERVVRYKRSLSVFMIDIDNFKNYNDTNGHLAGDKVILKVARVLSRTSRKSDIVARYGGEEFVVIAPEVDKKEALIYAERLRSAIFNEKFLNEKSQPGGALTISIGIAIYPEVNSNPQNLLKKADQALYDSKKNGRNLCSLYSDTKKGRKIIQ